MGILAKLEAEKRASPENPSTNLADPASWLTDALSYGTSTATGKRINEVTAMGNTALSACVSLLSETVATLPLHIYRRDGRNREVESNHPTARLIADPNPEMDAVQFRETLQAHALTWGNGFAEIEYNNAGLPIRLWPLLPHKTTMHRDDRGQSYYTTTVTGRTFVLPADRVFHLVGPGYDGLLGRSPIRQHREALGLSSAAEQFGAAWFGNGSRPSGVLTHPAALSRDAKSNLRKSWEAAHSGLTNSQRVAVLEEGVKWESIGIPPEDAQFLETRKFQVEEIARIYRVPLHLIQHMEKSTSWGSGIEELGQGLVTYTLQPWLVRWEQRIDSRLIPGGDRGTRYAKHAVEGLLRGDSAKRAEFYSRMIQIGVYSLNEVRALEDHNPIDGGDAHFVPLNLIPLDQATREMVLEPREAEPVETRSLPKTEERNLRLRRRQRDAYRPLFLSAAERVVRWEIARLEAALKRARAANNPDVMGEFVGDSADALRAYVSRQFGPVIASYAEAMWMQAVEELASEQDMPEDFRAFVDEYREGIANRWANESQASIRGIIANGGDPEDIFDALEMRLGSWEVDRAESQTNAEAVQSTGAFMKAAYGYLGVQVLRWAANPGACELCQQMDGRTVSITEPFIPEGGTVNAPNVSPLVVTRNIGHPPLHKGCGCDVVAG